MKTITRYFASLAFVIATLCAGMTPVHAQPTRADAGLSPSGPQSIEERDLALFLAKGKEMQGTVDELRYQVHELQFAYLSIAAQEGVLRFLKSPSDRVWTIQTINDYEEGMVLGEEMPKSFIAYRAKLSAQTLFITKTEIYIAIAILLLSAVSTFVVLRKRRKQSVSKTED